MTCSRALVALACALATAAPAQAAEPPLGEGAWSWFGDPRAVTVGDTTYVGWVDHEGDIKVSSYDQTSGERVTAVLQARLNQDDHANPSLHVRPDGRLVVFYSRHVGPAMHYRISTQPGDVRAWEPPQTLPTNVAGIRGYTYPNPIRLAGEGTTYLFWRGGNYNPTFSTQADGSSSWSPARNLILMQGERPYAKFASNGQDTIHVAYTNAHPNEFPDVNIYYARIRAGRMERAGGQDLGPLGEPIAPAAGDQVFNEAEPAWVHDVAADALGRPVIVFASFPSASDHRYHYARWTGTAWDVNEITAAGGSFREDGGSPYYSGGITLDHEDPSRVYLSRQVGAGAWQVEARTTVDGGASWTTESISASGTGRNVRPVSPRGMVDPFDDDLRVIWMRGSYPDYENYQTSITALTADESNLPPVADAEPDVRTGRAPLAVRFDGSFAHDPDGPIVSWEWDFGDGSAGGGEVATHTYASPGRYFPTLTVTDQDGATSTLVEEIAVGLPSAPAAYTGGAAGVTAHGAVEPHNQPTDWSFEYGPTSEYGAVTAARSLPGDGSLHQVASELPGLEPGRLYHYRLVATNASGSTEGEDRVMVAGRSGGSDAYRDAILSTPGLASYRRLGELSGSESREERGGPAAAFAGRFVLGQPGVLGALGDTAASFDGASGELVAPGPVLAASGTLEGWFRWRAGTTALRDNTGPSRGWLIAFSRGGDLAYRVGGTGFVTGMPIEDVRDGTWHHIVATKQGGAARLYVDGARVHEGSGAASDPAAMPWHVMRNGTNAVFSEGEADEIAFYGRALSADEVRSHYDTAGAVAGRALPPETPASVADPPAAGTGLGGGVLGAAARPAGRAFIRDGRLIVRGAPRTRSRLTARRRARNWVIADAAAPLRAGAGCRRLGRRTVACRAARVTRVVLFGGAADDDLALAGRARRVLLDGGAGDDRLSVAGRTRAILSGGPGRDRLVGGPFTRFRGGPGADLVTRRR